MEDRTQQVYDIFKNYYGEEYVDLQNDGQSIIVYFPEVRVKNEFDEGINIDELYVKTDITTDGKCNGIFTMSRGHYTTSQILANYLHSHAREIPSSGIFSRVCLGNGPIRNTISILSVEFDADRWALYCYELDKYVRVESLRGVPYHKLSTVSTSCLLDDYIRYNYDRSYFRHDEIIINHDMLVDFATYFIGLNKLKFVYNCGSVLIAHPFEEYLSIITKAFLNWIKTKEISIDACINTQILVKCKYKNGKFYIKSRRVVNRINDVENRFVCTFKNKDIFVTVTDDLEYVDDSKDIILNAKIALYILHKILNTINYANVRERNGLAREIFKVV